MARKQSNSSPLIGSADLFSVLREFNPWWDGRPQPDLPAWRRAAFGQVRDWLVDPPAKRALLLAGARQVGKTTLLLQAVVELIASGVAPSQILYATFDHPLFKLAGIDRVLKSWREYQPAIDAPEYLLLDEIQSVSDWQIWVKHQVDFRKDRRIAVTGSALPLAAVGQESGVGRWHTIKLPTLSFFEYLRIRGVDPPKLPEPKSLSDLFSWTRAQFVRTAVQAAPLVAHFHSYLLRGGFPQTARTESIPAAQRLLREDIVDKVLKRDMTALFGVRRILELEKLFVYLCMHDGGQLDLAAMASNLEINKQTVNNFIDLLEAANLIFKLRPYGYGKEVLRGRSKVYLADAAIAGSVLLRGEGTLRNPTQLGAAVECAFFKHVFTHYYTSSVGFTYWRDKAGREVDIVAEVGGRLIPFEVKYTQGTIGRDDLKGMQKFVETHDVARAYVVTRDMASFGPLSEQATDSSDFGRRVMLIPAPLACLWLSRLEHRSWTS